MAAGALHATPRREGETAAPAFRAGSVPVQRAELRVSSVHDAAEREAGEAARRVMQMPAPRIAPAAPALARSPVRVQRAAEGAPRAGGDTAARIQARKSGGQPLPAPLRRFMEPRFNADFSAVRVHADDESARLAQGLAARAFTTGAHVFFGRGQFQPETAAGRELVAHELAHTIQQGAAPQATVQRSEAPVLTPQPGGLVQRLGLSDILDGLAALAANVPGYTLLTLIIGRNPINLRAVERSFVNVLRTFMGLIPGGEILFQVLQRYGVVDRLGAWVNDQTAGLGLNFQTVRDAFTRFTDSLSWTDIFHPSDVWNRARSIFTPIIARITAFVSGLVSQAVTWLKETFMEPLAGFCREIPGYGLVTVMLGRDPFTNAAVPRTALTVVRAFAEFIPGGTEKVDQLVQSGALDRAYAWFQQETGARNLTWARVTGTFAEAWASLHLEDVLHPIDTLRRIVGLFRPLLADLVSFAGAALLKLLELIYEAAMGAGGRRILAILTRARATFVVIIRDPVGFLRNLMGAVGQGIRQFMTNILAHLRDGVIAWLTGPVAAAGVQMPERWDLRGIIGFVLQILGLTWARVREKLVRLIGAPAMDLLERGFALLQEIREKGLVQALRDRVTEFFGNLRDSALGAIRNFIQQRLVMAGITQLLSMLNPVGAIIQAIIKTYTTIQFFIQKIHQILDLVESIVNSIAAIASGAIGAAANFVERTMARTIPVILDFLARFIGLGDVGAQVQTTIRNLQGAVDRMLDRAVEWIRTQAQRVGSAVAGGVRRVVRAVSEWWRARKEFRNRRGESHAVYSEGSADSPRIMMASTPVPLEDYLNGLPDSDSVRAARRIYERQVVVIFRRRGANEEKLQQLTRALDDLSTALAAIDGVTPAAQASILPADDFPNPTPVQVKRWRVTLTNRGPGSDPADTPAYQIIRRNRDKLAERWSQLHLVNHEKFGGTGAAGNLVPGPESLNHSAQWTGFDNAMYRLIEQAPPQTAVPGLMNVVWIRASVTYHSGRSNILDSDGTTYIEWSHFASRVVLQGGLNAFDRVSNSWNVETAPRMTASIAVPRPDFDPAISLSHATRTVLERSGIAIFTDPTFGSDLRRLIRDGQPYSGWSAVNRRLDDVVNDPRGNRPYRTITIGHLPTILAALQAARAARLLKL